MTWISQRSRHLFNLRIHSARNPESGVVWRKNIDTQDGVGLKNDLCGLSFDWKDPDLRRLKVDIECL